MHMIGSMGMVQGSACGWPRHGRHGGPKGGLRDVVELSAAALRHMRRGHRRRCHHVRPNTARAQGLEREIGTLQTQLQGYLQAGSHDNVAATLQLIARDRAMQQAAMMGADV